VIPEIGIWRAATLMLKRYGEKALDESASRADELAGESDHHGAAIWRLITDAVAQLANVMPAGPLIDFKGEGQGPLPYMRSKIDFSIRAGNQSFPSETASTAN
jgi:hypothetical protein